MAENPKHIAIIMDGNGRWAQARGQMRMFGHQEGAKAVRRVVEACPELGVKYLTLYAFSSENWSRPEEEVTGLMSLLEAYLKNETAQLHKNKVRLKVIGDRTWLADKLQKLITASEELTANNDGLTLCILLSYGSRDEILSATRKLAEDVASGKIKSSDIDMNMFSNSLWTAGIPDPDLVIRTSGEKRLSNFLLWQVAYAEFLFMDVMWPDFDKNYLAQAIEEFKNRDRRYGKIK